MVGVSDVTPTGITLKWSRVGCNHTNGAVTGYRLRYREEGSGAEKTLTVSGEATLEAVVTGLRPGGLYSLRVAAMNSAGEGTYAQSVRGKCKWMSCMFQFLENEHMLHTQSVVCSNGR